MNEMRSFAKFGISTAIASVALVGVVGSVPASAKPSNELRAQCHIGGEMFITGAPKNTHHVDYWSGYTVTSSQGPRFAAPTYEWLEEGDWIYAFAMASDNTTVLAQNLHVVCKE